MNGEYLEGTVEESEEMLRQHSEQNDECDQVNINNIVSECLEGVLGTLA